jgi:hypothetical protein
MNHERLIADGWILAGNIGVDSGQVMVCDPCYAVPSEKDVDEKEAPLWEPQFTYDQACGWDKEPKDTRENFRSIPYKMGHEGAAVVTNSGYGDGYYPVYVKLQDKGDWGTRVVAMMVDFDTDDPDDSCEED